MAIVKSNIAIIYKLVELTFNSDGSSDLVLWKGFMDGPSFVRMNILKFHVIADDVNVVLDTAPAGITRRDDIAKAIYEYLTTKGYIEGVVT